MIFSFLIIQTCLIFHIQIIFVDIIKLFITTILHHLWGYFIWEFLYYIIQGIPIRFCYIFNYIAVCHTFIFSFCLIFTLSIINISLIFLIQMISFAIIKFLISTILHYISGCVIWAFFYKLIQGIPFSFIYIFIHIAMYHIFIFSLC